METFYWHDYETWGVNPAIDKPSQFAGVRTDYDFNIVGEPLNILCQPALDTLPHVEACLVTGITPQQAERDGLPEHAFFAAIHSELARAGTCSVGYNSIRFDDEVTRYGLYRNFYDPYAREWQNGNTRWDIIDMIRLCYAVRPNGFEWPLRDDGVVSFRLEQLTAANGLVHEAAHDALSDVYATIALAKLVRQRQPKLFDHLFALRHKKFAQQALSLGSNKPLLHISSKFGSELGCGSLILPVAQHPDNKNEIICIDLRYSPDPLLDFSADKIAELLYTRIDQLPEGVDRIPIKSVHINRSPVVLSPGLIDDNVAERLSLDVQQCEQHRQRLLAFPDLAGKLQLVMASIRFDNSGQDAEEQLYSGFFSNNDRYTMRSIPSMNRESLADATFSFEDARLPELLFRYRARNFPGSLSGEEQQQWLEYCRGKLLGNDSTAAKADAAANDCTVIDTELDKISAMLDRSCESAVKAILQALQSYLQNKKQALLDGMTG